MYWAFHSVVFPKLSLLLVTFSNNLFTYSYYLLLFPSCSFIFVACVLCVYYTLWNSSCPYSGYFVIPSVSELCFENRSQPNRSSTGQEDGIMDFFSDLFFIPSL